MICLILPGERWQTLLPEPLLSSIKSVAKHRKMERTTRTTPSVDPMLHSCSPRKMWP
jgi:hypothetical protein